MQYKIIFGDDFQWNQVSCQHLFGSGGGDASPESNPVSAPASVLHVCVGTVGFCTGSCRSPGGDLPKVLEPHGFQTLVRTSQLKRWRNTSATTDPTILYTRCSCVNSCVAKKLSRYTAHCWSSSFSLSYRLASSYWPIASSHTPASFPCALKSLKSTVNSFA